MAPSGAERKGKEMRKNMEMIKNSLGAKISFNLIKKNMYVDLLSPLLDKNLTLQEIYDSYCVKHKNYFGFDFYFEKVIRNKNGALLEYSDAIEKMDPYYKETLELVVLISGQEITCQQFYEMYCLMHKRIEKEEFFTEEI